MNYTYKFFIAGLVAVSFYGGNAYAVDVRQRIGNLERITKSLGAELTSLKECIPARACTKKQYEQIKALGKKIVIAIAALTAAAFVGKLAHVGYRKVEAPRYVERIMREKGISQDPNVNLYAKEDYDYLYAATTMPKGQWEAYQQKLFAVVGEGYSPELEVGSAAEQIRKERWGEVKRDLYGQELT